MPQLQLPLFPAGTNLINSELGFERRGDSVVYFNGHLPVFTHAVDDLAAFRLFTTQLAVNGSASQGEIARAFGVPLITVKRCVKRYREHGAKVFFTPHPKRRGNRLTPERLLEAQKMLDEFRSVPEIARVLGVLNTTLHKAIDDGRLRQPPKKNAAGSPGTRIP
jgi:biotin operon repressor